jgi:hypothetical protein
VLFKGSRGRIGQTVPLETRPDLEELATALGASNGKGQVWDHGLPMLMGRIVNRRGRDVTLGVSDYDLIFDQLLDLNEATTIAGENVRLTAKRRVVVPEEAVQPAAPELVDNGDGLLVPAPFSLERPIFDAGEDVLTVSRLDRELGAGSSAPFTVLEYTYDALPLIAHKRDIVETATTRVGLTPQYLGVVADQGDGFAASGTALRLRLIPTTRGGRGKARPWDSDYPRILSLMARLDALSEEQGGFGRSWRDAVTPPAVERGNPLPHDEVEDAGVESTLVAAGVRSVKTSVKAQHPDWTGAQVDEEVAAIKADRPAASGLFGGA